MSDTKQMVKPAVATPELDLVHLSPPVDIYENDNEVLIVADMPGVTPDMTTVRLEPPRLLLEGRPPRHAQERAVLYERVFRVSDDIDPNGIAAHIEAGVLSVHLKKSDASKPRRIEVRAGK
ncbi:MAG: Hsp20/alpha crystallin family protein [Polyangiaceae bacterium]|nr:Hsp20/alpha crystallin family protein [Polyangiaceae bacterium]